MAGQSLTLMLLLVSWGYVHCRVEPPADLVITDPGHLGNLEISWSPSQQLSHQQQDQCSVLYELHYFDTYSSSWTSVRTSHTSFHAQFDLGKEVQVLVYTVLTGACVEGRTVKSEDFTGLVQKPNVSGADGVQDLTCVYYHMEHMDCRWERSSKMPLHSQETLYYWHRELAHAQECPHYIIVSDVRIGCNFSGIDLPTFSDINLCVNATSPVGHIRPLYTSLQIQNHVKPKMTEEISVEMDPDRQLWLHWNSPGGRIPQHCLEWQVEDSRGHAVRHITSTETDVTLPLSDNETSCLRVRSRLSKYCAKSSVWSDWSPSECYPEKKLLASEPRWDMLPQYVYIAVTIITVLVLGLCLWAACKLRQSKQGKKMDPSFTTLFDKTSAVGQQM